MYGCQAYLFLVEPEITSGAEAELIQVNQPTHKKETSALRTYSNKNIEHIYIHNPRSFFANHSFWVPNPISDSCQGATIDGG